MNEHPLKKLSEDYLLSKNFSVSTLKSYKNAYKYFIEFLECHQIVIAKTKDVLRYREHKRELGHSAHYIHVHMSALKGLYEYLKIHQNDFGLPKDYAYNIMEMVSSEKIKPTLKKCILTLEETRHLILHTKKSRKSFWHYRDHAIIYLMITLGLSVHEIIHLKREHYQAYGEKRVLIFKKNHTHNNSTYQTLPKGATLALDEYLALRKDDNPYLFITRKNKQKNHHLSRTFFKAMMPRVLHDAGFDERKITPHALRHTAAILNLKRGGTLLETRRLLRHESITSTLIYQDYLERLESRVESKIDAFILKEEEGAPDEVLWDWFLNL
jgi:integrase/recombinase XerD